LDLADLASVRTFADSVESVDVLVNNAGVVGPAPDPHHRRFRGAPGTNHLGHFALTCLLGDKITDRVISVASVTYHLGRIDLDEPELAHPQVLDVAAYEQSKLATMLFTNELARRGVGRTRRIRAWRTATSLGTPPDCSTGIGEHVQPHVAQSAPHAARANIEA